MRKGRHIGGTLQYSKNSSYMVLRVTNMHCGFYFNDNTCVLTIPYSRKYWQELNLAVWPLQKYWRILILAVRYGIAMRIYVSKKFWRILIWRLLKSTAKPPNFPAIRYAMKHYCAKPLAH